jgi:hypothetical protein
MKKKDNIMNTKYYKFERPFWVSKNLIVKESIMVIKSDKSYIQGVKNASLKLTEEVIASGCLVEIEKPSDEFLNEFVVPTKEYINCKGVISKLKKEFVEYKNIWSAVETWAFQTKGSAAANYTREKEFQSNREGILEGTLLRGGMLAKPGKYMKNRSTRQTPVGNEKEWSKDETTLAPNGIRQSDYCGFSDSVEIFNDMLTQIISMNDTPTEIVEFIESLGYKKMDSIHVDNFYKTPISWKEFEKNTHHGKVKGLEFCHINPNMDYPTRGGNVEIGLCIANRHQGGYSLDFTYRKLLIKDLIESGYGTDVEDLNTLSKKELKEIDYKRELMEKSI